MRFTPFAFLISISLPLVVNASHISARREEPHSHAPRPAPVPTSAPALASGSAPVPVPTAPSPPSSLKNTASDFPLDANRGEFNGFPGKASPLGSKHTRIEKHRRQFHNADFASSGPPPSSDVEPVASDDEVHERRFAY